MGKPVSIEEFDHCSQCLVCFEHSFWCCKKCGTSTARLCQLCNPASEAKCNVCRQPLVIDDEDQETFVTTSSESLQSLSQLEDFQVKSCLYIVFVEAIHLIHRSRMTLRVTTTVSTKGNAGKEMMAADKKMMMTLAGLLRLVAATAKASLIKRMMKVDILFVVRASRCFHLSQNAFFAQSKLFHFQLLATCQDQTFLQYKGVAILQRPLQVHPQLVQNVKKYLKILFFFLMI